MLPSAVEGFGWGVLFSERLEDTKNLQRQRKKDKVRPPAHQASGVSRVRGAWKVAGPLSLDWFDFQLYSMFESSWVRIESHRIDSADGDEKSC